MLKLVKTRWIELVTIGLVSVFASILQLFFMPLEVMLMSFSFGSLIYMTFVLIVFIPLDHEALSRSVGLWALMDKLILK